MRYVFGDCTLDTQRYELHRGGTRMPLRPKVFQVLVYLIEQRDRVVTRDEVLAQVWPNQHVGEETLTSCVKAARRAVGDSGRTQRVIQTVHSRGLRFVADVTVVDGLPAPLIAPPPAQALAPRVAPPPTCGRPGGGADHPAPLVHDRPAGPAAGGVHCWGGGDWQNGPRRDLCGPGGD